MTETPTIKRDTPATLSDAECIAMHIGKEVAEHLENSHGMMLDAATSRRSTLLSVRNSTFNAVMSAMKAAENGTIGEHIAQCDRHRRDMRKLRKIAANASPGTQRETMTALHDDIAHRTIIDQEDKP